MQCKLSDIQGALTTCFQYIIYTTPSVHFYKAYLNFKKSNLKILTNNQLNYKNIWCIKIIPIYSYFKLLHIILVLYLLRIYFMRNQWSKFNLEDFLKSKYPLSKLTEVVVRTVPHPPHPLSLTPECLLTQKSTRSIPDT